MDSLEEPSAANNRYRSSSVSTFLYAPRNSLSHFGITTTTTTLGNGSNGNNYASIPRSENETYQRMSRKYQKYQKIPRRPSDRPEVLAKVLSEKLTSSWIEKSFQKRECVKFILDTSTERCGCGRLPSSHSNLALSRFTTSIPPSEPYSPDTMEPDSPIFGITSTNPLSSSAGLAKKKWTIADHTRPYPTDSFGTIEFQGGPHPHIAHYVRLAFDSDPADIVHLMETVWNLPKPKLVITIHGGVTNFGVPDKLGKAFREGLLKAAQTTGAWIITSGIDSGVVRHVAQALDEAGISARMRSQILLIGIAPWGLVRRRDKLIGHNAHVTYEHPSYCSHNKHHPVLNDRHSYFLLVDNGTIGRYGADIILRKRFEDYIAQKVTLRVGNERTPIICLTVEGGLCTINSALQYLKGIPPIPVIVFEGTGRASDFIAYAEKHLDSKGNLEEPYRTHLFNNVTKKLSYNHTKAEEIVSLIIQCARHHDLLTIYRANDDENKDVDQVILRALLKGQNLTPVEQLSLTLAWNRVDMARSEVFSTEEGVPAQALTHVMMNALLLNRVDFFKLLIEQGVSMKKFLTISRLEQLYNAEQSSLSTLYHLIGDKTQKLDDESFTLPEIGVAIEKLMGNAYRCHYTTRAFKSRYDKFKTKTTHQISRISSFHLRLSKEQRNKRKKKERNLSSCASEAIEDFKYPFNDLMLWAVLTQRHELAKCLWNHGEEAMAKALVAIRLYKCMSKEAADDYTEVEVSNQLREYAEDFRECSLDLLNHCYQQDDVMTMKMLTAELPNWGHHTCLSLAVIANNKRLLAHPCCQVLLAELWHGGLRFRSQSNIKVILAVLFPPTILLLDFKKPTYPTKPRKELPSTADSEDSEDIKMNGSVFNISLNSIFRANAQLANRFLRRSTITAPPPELFIEPPENRNSILSNESDHLLATPLSPEPMAFMGEKKSVQLLVPSMKQQQENREEKDDVFIRNFSSASSRQGSSMTWKRRFSDWISNFVLFYRAPITSFWIWSISFATFMFFFTYILIIEFYPEITYIEWFLFFYVAAFGLEHFRKLFITESSSFMEKFFVFYNRYWNILTTIAILTFFIGFYYRFYDDVAHTHSRVILASNSVLWYMKVYDYLSVHPRIGPYITMAGKMVLAMSYIIIMLLVTLMAFGVARQSITFPHEKWSWYLVRNIFYKPYFMLYGEVYAGEIDTCGDEGTNCVPGGWIPPLLMTIFLLIANILLINMLIAIFNNIFNVTNAMSQQVWMFQRYYQVLEFQSTPIIPPPFTPLIHVYKIIQYFYRRCRGKRSKNKGDEQRLDLAIKVYLDEGELKKLHDFEEDCMDDLARRHKLSHISPTVYQNLNKHDPILIKQLTEENATLRTEIEKVEHKLSAMEQSQILILQILQSQQNQQQVIIPSKPPTIPSTTTSNTSNNNLQQSIGLRRRSLSIARPSTLSAVEDHPQPQPSSITVVQSPTGAATTKPPQIKPLSKLSMRKRHSVSLSEDMEQMQMMSSPNQISCSTHDEGMDDDGEGEKNGNRKISSTSMISTESSRSSSIHSLSSFNEINFNNSEKFK